jgi:acyl-CoA dehydrogenase
MLMSMKSQIEAMRALAYVVAAAMDHAHANPDPATRDEREAFVELMTPVVKGWCTETAVEIVSTALQVHGGMGFIEETGAAQYYRDARISTIYEGTTAIQANDLVGRKLLRDRGKTVARVVGAMQALDGELAERGDAQLAAIRSAFAQGLRALHETSMWLGASASKDLRLTFAGSVPYLKLWGIVAGGWQMARAALIAQEKLATGSVDAEFYRAKVATTRFYADHILSRALSLEREIIAGSASVMGLSEEQFELDRARMALA